MTTQLELLKSSSITNNVIEPKPISITNNVIEPKTKALMKFCHRDKSEGGKGGVNKYLSSKCNNYYYRFSYRLGNRIKHKHIPGGRVCSPLAEKRAAIVRDMIAREASTLEILNMISAFS